MATISGEVRDENNDLLADCVVRAYRRDTGALLVAGLSGDGTEAVPGNDLYPYTKLLVHCNGENNSTTFTDVSATPKTITTYGNAKISTVASQFDGASALFDGSSGRFGCTLNISGTDDIAIGCWVRPTSGGGQSYSRLWIFGADTAGSLGLFTDGSGSPRRIGLSIWNPTQYYFWSDGTIPNDQFSHIEARRVSGTWYLFINGTKQAGSITQTMSVTQTDFNVGAAAAGTENFSGYIDEVMVATGYAWDTANFTPPTAAYLETEGIPDKPLGEYTLTTAYTGEVQVIALDPTGGTTFNDLILRTTPV